MGTFLPMRDTRNEVPRVQAVESSNAALRRARLRRGRAEMSPRMSPDDPAPVSSFMRHSPLKSLSGHRRCRSACFSRVVAPDDERRLSSRSGDRRDGLRGLKAATGQRCHQPTPPYGTRAKDSSPGRPSSCHRPGALSATTGRSRWTAIPTVGPGTASSSAPDRPVSTPRSCSAARVGASWCSTVAAAQLRHA